MKQMILIAMLTMGLGLFAIAQPGRGEKIEAIKVAYITRELNLTADEAQRFWPVYNEYFKELKKAVMENRGDELAAEEKVLNIRKKYKADFKKVLGDDVRVNKVYQVDRKFHEMLRKEMQERMKNRKRPARMPNDNTGN